MTTIEEKVSGPKAYSYELELKVTKILEKLNKLRGRAWDLMNTAQNEDFVELAAELERLMELMRVSIDRLYELQYKIEHPFGEGESEVDGGR